MIREIPATELRAGMVMALPFGKTATVLYATVGRTYVNFRTEHGPSRVERGAPMLIEVPDER